MVSTQPAASSCRSEETDSRLLLDSAPICGSPKAAKVKPLPMPNELVLKV